MIEQSKVKELAAQWLQGRDYFLCDVSVTTDNRILVEIDHQDGVWIDDCVALSRFIEDALDREADDFELEVGSAGLGQPFKVLRQYEIHQGHQVDVQLKDGHKLCGTLADVTAEGFTLIVQEKIKAEGEKRPHLEDVPHALRFDDVAWTKYHLDFK